jgi:hypothetical protein
MAYARIYPYNTPVLCLKSTSQTIELRKVFGKPTNLWRKRVSIA